MKYLYVIVVLLIFSLLGCVCNNKSHRHVNKINLTFDSRATPTDVIQQVESVDFIVLKWEEDNGPTNQLFISITMDKLFLCGKTESIGCYTFTLGGYAGIIKMIAGENNSVPALYHEMCHRNGLSKAFKIDKWHQDPLWPKWKLRGSQLSEILKDKNK